MLFSLPSSFPAESIPYVTGGGLSNRYNFVQFHFHWGNDSSHGSEHRIKSKRWSNFWLLAWLIICFIYLFKGMQGNFTWFTTTPNMDPFQKLQNMTTVWPSWVFLLRCVTAKLALFMFKLILKTNVKGGETCKFSIPGCRWSVEWSRRRRWRNDIGQFDFVQKIITVSNDFILSLFGFFYSARLWANHCLDCLW